MSDVHAYRASAELAAMLTARAAEVRAWIAEVVAWDEQHPDTPMVWSRSPFGGDKCVRGFADKKSDQPAPDGLSRAQSRSFLAPKRGKAGEPWREVMRRFDRYPSVDQVLRDHDVPDHVLAFDEARSYMPGLLEDGGTWWITCRRPLFDGDEHPHLTRVPLSTYYAAKEAAAARRDTAEATAGGSGIEFRP